MRDTEKTRAFHDEDTAAALYDSRYRQGYLDVWPDAAVDKVRDVLLATQRATRMAERGVAIDFGCGSGFFTNFLAQHLRTWRVAGMDPSGVALERARACYPSLEFHPLGSYPDALPRADFLFTHHVLEHVANLERTRDAIARLVAPTSTMLHVLPCGNAGSLTHRFAASRRGGIQADLENRFWFEDESHLRRLTSHQVVGLFAPLGFRPIAQYFSGQFWGALDYFTGTEPLVIPHMTELRRATSPIAAIRLAVGGWSLRALAAARRIARAQQEADGAAKIDRLGRIRRRVERSRAVGALARVVDPYVAQRATREWAERSLDPRGDQMFIALHREVPGCAS